MEFLGKSAALTPECFTKVCTTMGVPAETVWAVLSVETGGVGFQRDQRLAMRFEPHVFADFVGNLPPGLSGDTVDYNALAIALRCDEEAALKSTSWGIGQIMGFNAELVGYRKNGVRGMVAAFADGENAQISAMMQFAMKTGIDRSLHLHDWAAFAYVYNGPGYRANRYDEKLAAAFEKFRLRPPDIKVRAEQIDLMFRGFYNGRIDGINGPQTRAARAAAQGIARMVV